MRVALGLLSCAGVAALLTGCAVTRHGVLTNPKEGRSIPIDVVIRGDSAEISGVDPVTGERFSGLLVVDEEQRRSPAQLGEVAPPVGGGSGAGPGTAPIGLGRSSVGGLNLVGTLEGDRGTRLRCAVELKQRVRLDGEGLCQALDSDSDLRLLVRF